MEKKKPVIKAKMPQDAIVVNGDEPVITGVADGAEVTMTDSETTVQEGSNLSEGTDLLEDADADVEDTDALETETETEVKTTTEDTTPEITFTEPVKDKKIPDQNVKIKVGREYACTIGGIRYFFEKDKVAIVPKNVKEVLSEEDNLLKPL